jgi:serine/threonine protein phosphatase PrpC
MNCPACGTENRDGAHFCRSCGANLLESEAASITESSAETEREDAMPEEAVPERVVSDEDASKAKLTESPVGESGSDEEVRDAAMSVAEVEVEPEETGPEPGEEAAVAAATQVEAPAEEKTPEESHEKAEPAPMDQPMHVEDAPAPDRVVEAETGEFEPLPELEGDLFAFWREEADLMTPLEPDTVIGGRFVVVEALDIQEKEILYQAQDLMRCWQCGYEDNDPGGAFCARCGVLMDHRPEVRLLEVRDAEAKPSTGMIVVARLSHGSRHFLLLAEPAPERKPKPEVPPETRSFRLLVGQRSDAGQVREIDEDSLFVLTLSPTYESRTGPVLGLFAVADGMGGHAAGEVASRIALQSLADRVMRTIILPEIAGELVWEDDILAFLRQATIAANDAVYLARKKRENDMGTTLTTALIRDDRLFLAHVGDGRMYRFSANGLEQLTTDHSVVASMVAEGQIEPEEIYTHPHRSIVSRCIGDKPVVEVDSDLLPLHPGDRIIVCCDGLWEMVRNEGIEDVMMQEADPQAACDLLVRRANAAGGEDNISVIVVQLEAMIGLED